MKQYGDESIKRQSAVETCRKNLPTFFGSIDVSGATQSIKEILSNSIDEAKAGAGDEIFVTIHKDNSVTVKDFGRGLPLDWNKGEENWNWENNLQTLHAGGKFEGTRDNFKNATGMNGLGLACTAMSSEWIKVESRYGGYIYNVELKKGVPTIDNPDKVLKKEKDPKGKSQKTGTTISWKCDTDEVYLSDNFDLDYLKYWCKTQAILTDGVAVKLKDERHNFEETYLYKDGIRTFAEEQAGKDTKLIEFTDKGNGKDAAKFKSYDVNCRIIFAFTENSGSYWYHNSLPLTLGGSPQKAEQEAFLEFFQKQTKNKKISFDDIQENLFYISNTLTEISPIFRNQTKDAIDMPFIQAFLKGKIEKQLDKWAKDNPLELDKICQQVVVNQEARMTSASVRQMTKEKLSGKIKLSAKIDKFTECRSRDNTKTEVFIGEGDSACGSIIQARNSEFQAVFALKGKILNVLKTDLGKIMNHPVTVNLLKVIGTGIQMGDSKKKNQIGDFDINNRRFDKYIFATDQDVDGMHIVSLGLTMFYTLMPELIRQGKVYVLDTPLFVLNLKNGEKVYAFSDVENEKLQKQYKDKIKSIDRKKGLGEWKPKDFAYFLDPTTRHLTQITIEDAKLAQKNLELMMAEDSDLRKDYIEKHANEYKDIEVE